MNLYKEFNNINNRWGIEGDSDYDKFNRFKLNIQDCLFGIDKYIHEISAEKFCKLYGKKRWTHWDSVSHKNDVVKDKLNEENVHNKFFCLIEIIFLLGFVSLNKKIQLANEIKEIVDFSGLDLCVNVKKDGRIILYKKGEELLDEKITDKILSFLESDSEYHFTEALKYYKKEETIKSAENLRRSLEEFLRLKLNNKTGLQGNIPKLRKLFESEKEINSEIKTLTTHNLSFLDHHFFNNNSKHNNGKIDEIENEYLIYQVALLMLYIEKKIN